MVSTHNMSKSQMNPLRLPNQQENVVGRQQENPCDFLPDPEVDPPMMDPPPNNELEALRLANQRLLQQNEELLNLIQHPQKAQPAQNDPPQGEHQHLNPLKESR